MVRYYLVQNKPVIAKKDPSASSATVNAYSVGSLVAIIGLESGWYKTESGTYIFSDTENLIPYSKWKREHPKHPLVEKLDDQIKPRLRFSLTDQEDDTDSDQQTQTNVTQTNKKESQIRVANSNSVISNADMLNDDIVDVDKLRGVFGFPYQFLPNTDRRITNASGSNEYSLLGRKYKERIASRAPIMILQAGCADIMMMKKNQ